MASRAIHENLDTSYVNLSALLRYLRRRQFIGSVSVALNGYEAQISLSEGNRMHIREHDILAGRVAEGEEALQRLLIRSREPGGVINVYQTVATQAEAEKEKPQILEEKMNIAPVVEKPGLEIKAYTNGNGNHAPIPVKVIESEEPQNGDFRPASAPSGEENKRQPSAKPGSRAHDTGKLPFELRNEMESKAKSPTLSAREWQTLLQLCSELLSTVDKSLAEAKLDFVPAFRKARLEISGDYPFLHPVSGSFLYSHGKITMREQVSGKLFTASLNEALKKILDKLGANPTFTFVHRSTVQRIIALIRQRKEAYDHFGITPGLERIVGI